MNFCLEDLLVGTQHGQPCCDHLGQALLHMRRMIRKDTDILSLVIGLGIGPAESSAEVEEDVQELCLL